MSNEWEIHAAYFLAFYYTMLNEKPIVHFERLII